MTLNDFAPPSIFLRQPVPVSLANNLLIVLSDCPAPPGSRVQVYIAVPAVSTPLEVTGKVVNIEACKPSSYLIRIRLNSLTKQQKTLLETVSWLNP